MITQKKSRRGRPATGKGLMLGVRLQPHAVAAIDAWIGRHPEPRPTRPEAIRRLVEMSLTREVPGSVSVDNIKQINNSDKSSNAKEEYPMAKGQMRSSKEAKKPKAEKPKGEASNYKKSQGKDKQSIRLPDAKG